MAEQYALQSEVAEEYDRVIVGIDSVIIIIFPFITVFCQELIQFGGYPVIFFFYMAVFHDVSSVPEVAVKLLRN